ncbi:pseudaminic acid cytidylyltransferase [Alteriqipengyuania sp.]|uniref:pseudaminic acid cytidylyltransferase n=1 Tax=Alteriqipengyuania sp. TaxID=2800692 RepID=UPI00351100EF
MKIAVIPARGGSKRIPRKNIKPFAGKPMIGYAIEAALACEAIDRVVVSTDDEEISAIARELGAELPFRRPAELADDITPTVPVIAHAVEACREQGWDVTHACCIYPGVPFIRTKDLAAALELLEEHGGEGYTFPVAEFPSVIQRALKRDETGAVAPFNPEHTLTRTQDLEPAFYDAGQFYWGKGDTWTAGLNVHANGRAIVLPEWRVVDIDTPDDWDRAERLYSAFTTEA